MSVPASEAWTEEVEAAHRALSPLDAAFRRRALEEPRLLDRETFRELHDAGEAFHYRIQSWPLFVDRPLVEELAEATVGIGRAIRRLPRAIFDGDPARIAAYYSLPDPHLVALFLAEPDGVGESLGRGDFLLTEDGFRCLEMNMTASLGGWQAGLLAEMLLRIPEVASFVAEARRPVTHAPVLRRIFEHLLSHAVERGIATERVNTGLTYVGKRAPVTPLLLSVLERDYREALERVGVAGEVGFVDPPRLTERGGDLYDGDRRIHVLLELQREIEDPRVFRAFKRSRLALHNGPARLILSDKRNLALLSEHATSPRLTEEERAVVARYVPWTRIVSPGPVEVDGETARIEELLGERERWVLKRGRGSGGDAVVVGARFSAGCWEEAVRAALAAAGEWVVQAREEGRAYLFQHGADGAVLHDLVWGPFLAGDRYAGSAVRTQPRELGGVVNMGHGAGEGTLFEVGPPPAGGAQET